MTSPSCPVTATRQSCQNFHTHQTNTDSLVLNNFVIQAIRNNIVTTQCSYQHYTQHNTYLKFNINILDAEARSQKCGFEFSTAAAAHKLGRREDEERRRHKSVLTGQTFQLEGPNLASICHLKRHSHTLNSTCGNKHILKTTFGPEFTKTFFHLSRAYGKKKECVWNTERVCVSPEGRKGGEEEEEEEEELG